MKEVTGDRLEKMPLNFKMQNIVKKELKNQWRNLMNSGVEPDIQLVNDPGLMARGRDPQLERAIQEVLKMLEKNPPSPPKQPILPGQLKR